MAEELAPADSLSEEDFDKAFQDLMSQPQDDELPPEEDDELEEDNGVEEAEEEEEPSEAPEADSDEEDEDEEDNDPEQPEDVEPESEDEPDEEQSDEEVEDETEDSAQDKPKDEPFDFNQVPLDVPLPMEIPANGMKVKATINELIEGFKKGMNYTQKMQELAPLRRSMSIVSSEQLSEEDLNLLAEIKRGSKEAVAKMLKDNNIDPLDVETDGTENYTPTDYGKDEVDPEMEYARQEILADTEYVDVVKDAIDKMPDDMYEVVSGSANGLRSLHKDIKNGIYQQVMPEVIKAQTLYGKSEPTLESYLKIANKLLGSQQSAQPDLEDVQRQEVQKQEQDRVKQQERADKRKKVAPSNRAPAKKESFINDDINSLGEDEFDKAFEKIMGRSLNDYK